MLDRELEGLRNVVGVNVVHKLGPEAWDGDLPAGRECVPDVRVEISQRPDRWPAGAADVTGLEHRGDQAAG
jgi:hypothetical protein